MISCQQYDYIEIACMYHYPLKITMKSGSVIEGKAIDTARDTNQKECIKVHVDNVEKLIALDQINTLEAMINNPHFKVVSLT